MQKDKTTKSQKHSQPKTQKHKISDGNSVTNSQCWESYLKQVMG